MKTPRASLVLWVLFTALAGYGVGRCTAPGSAAGDASSSKPGAQAAAPTLWTCPMHPQILLPDPVPCPICGMELVPQEGGDEGPRRLSMSPDDRKLAEIEVARVERRSVTREVRMVGKVDFDETRMRTVSSRIPGESRLERLYVDYTGVRVKAGEHLVSLYSPVLLTAQEELLEAYRRLPAAADESSAFLAASSRRAYDSAREKLLLFGLTDAQIDALEQSGASTDHVMITSPVSGIVIHKMVNQGDYVGVGAKIYVIADLDHLWVRLDAYEQDLAWLRFGQAVSIVPEAFPGDVFDGTIAFIDPVLDDRRRTVKVRVNINNENGRLKPGMFVRALVRSPLGGGGRALDASLAGKWISPMHPEIVKDGPGTCDVCGMPLVPAEELGFFGPAADAALPLVVPASAVLITGRRAVAYVEVPGTLRPTYEGREVTLGPRAGDVYVVRAGLEEGERVVVQGAFKIDSSLQIQAKPSMMSGPARDLVGSSGSFLRASLAPVYAAYLGWQEALAADDVDAARAQRAQLGTALADVTAWDADAEVQRILDVELHALRTATAAPDGSLAELRASLRTASHAVLHLEHALGHRGDEPRLEVFCPMAFDNEGAAWLQRPGAVANPYFGASMLRCGEVRATLPGAGGRAEPEDPK